MYFVSKLGVTMRLILFAALIREFRDNGAMTRRELADIMERSADSVWHWTRTLEAEGVLVQVGMKGQAKLWDLAPKGTRQKAPYIRTQKSRAAAKKELVGRTYVHVVGGC